MSRDAGVASDVSTAEFVFRGKVDLALRPRQSLVFPAVGDIAGPAAMDASVAVANRKDAVVAKLWREAAHNPGLLELLRDLDEVFEVRPRSVLSGSAIRD